MSLRVTVSTDEMRLSVHLDDSHRQAVAAYVLQQHIYLEAAWARIIRRGFNDMLAELKPPLIGNDPNP